MKKLLSLMIFLLSVLSLSAQENKRFENNILLGAGVSLESGERAVDYNPGLVFRLSYGLDIRLNERWSVMPGAGLRGQGGPVRHIGLMNALRQYPEYNCIGTTHLHYVAAFCGWHF